MSPIIWPHHHDDVTYVQSEWSKKLERDLEERKETPQPCPHCGLAGGAHKFSCYPRYRNGDPDE